MSTAVAKKPLRQVDNVKELLHNDQARGQLAAVAAKHMSPERLMRVTANAIRTTPKLQEADPLSFLGALMQCAALGLEPQTVLGHAYLVPFWNGRKKVTEVQVIVGYKGLIDLARRSGHITSISANIHYSDDELWEYEEGTEARLRHRPGPQEGEKLHAYAIAQFRDGGHAYVVLPWSHVIKIRDGSQNWQNAKRNGKTDSSPWRTHEDAMAKKTAIRALAKYLPLSVEFMDAVQMDHDGGTHVDYASYAMNPEQGPAVQPEGDTIDGTAAEVGGDEDEAADGEEGAEGAKPAERSKPAAQGKPTRTAKSQKAPSNGAPTDAEAAEAKSHPQHFEIVEKIEADIADGAPASGTLSFYEQELNAMEGAAPALYKRAMDAIEGAQ